jgi:type II secretory pathway pseudopilin PulG
MKDRKVADRGETLLEVLIAVVILGLTGVAILGTLGTTIAGSTQHRRQATALTVADSAAEYVKTQGYQTACGAMPTPTAASVNTSGDTLTITGPIRVDGSACVASDTLQVFTVRVTAPNGSAVTRSVNVLVRQNT